MAGRLRVNLLNNHKKIVIEQPQKSITGRQYYDGCKSLPSYQLELCILTT